MQVAEITYFSDVLCVWAYVSQARVDAVKEKFGAAVRLDERFCSVFGDTASKIATTWKDRGGHAGFNAHLRHVAERFPHVPVHPGLWLTARPATSASAHLFLKAVQLWEREARDAGDQAVPGCFDRVTRLFRQAFFRDCRDIAQWETQCEIAHAAGVDITAIAQRIHSGVAFARLAADYQDADKMRIEGSPSYVLNEGRQKLYGNVGFHVLEANIQEILRSPRADEASWC